MERILHVSNYYPPSRGGIEQACSDTVYTLRDRYEQVVICFNHEKGTVDEIIDGIRVIRVGCFAKVASQSLSLNYKKMLKSIIEEFKPDYVHFHYPNPFVSHFLLKIIKKTNIKLIIHWHLDITKQKIIRVFFEKQNKKLLEKAEKIIATSPNYVEGSPYLSKYKDKVCIAELPINDIRMKLTDENIINAKKIKEKYKDKLIGLYLGRHVEHKGLRKLIEASKMINDDYVFIIGGKGPLTEEMKELAKNDEKIIFVGQINDDEYREYLYACDFFLFPSLTKAEAFGLALAEAMYYAKPTITFNIPGSGVNYVSLKGITGLEVENGNVEKYKDAILEMKDSELRNTFGENGRKRVMENFTFEKYQENIKKVYK